MRFKKRSAISRQLSAFRLTLLVLSLPHLGTAQDERRVVSPNGQLEFRLGVAEPESGALSRLAYQITYRGKPLINTSLLGLNIHFQEPLLGENVGLTSSQHSETAHYHSLIAHYMQNGSLARRIDLEVRAADDGIAFRYLIPPSTPLDELLIEDETTEFNFAHNTGPGRAGSDAAFALPLTLEQPGIGKVSITEVRDGRYPRASLVHAEANIWITRLSAATHPGIAFEGTTPFTCPWRVVIVGHDRDHVSQAEILKSLSSP